MDERLLRVGVCMGIVGALWIDKTVVIIGGVGLACFA